MQDVLGVINLLSNQDNLGELTLHRTLASVPFGARYRLIDFPLSNMVNSGIRDVAIFTRDKYRSLMDHLGTGKEWDLDRKKGGLFILPPFYNTDHKISELEHFYHHIDFFQKADQENILMINGTKIFNMDFHNVYQSHKHSKADITFLYEQIYEQQANIFKKGKMIDITSNGNMFLDMFFIKKSLFIDIVTTFYKKEKFKSINDVIINELTNFSIQGVPYNGYVAHVNSVNDYYRTSIELLDPYHCNYLFTQPSTIYTKLKDEAPTRYTETSHVKNSLVANGVVIEGDVENSILFRGVKVHKDAKIKNSIILQKCEIGEGAYLENVILDKEVKVSKGKSIISNQEQPYVVEKKVVV